MLPIRVTISGWSDARCASSVVIPNRIREQRLHQLQSRPLLCFLVLRKWCVQRGRPGTAAEEQLKMMPSAFPSERVHRCPCHSTHSMS